MLPLDEAEVRRQLSSQPGLLGQYDAATAEQRKLWSSPFFLDAFLRNGLKGEDKSSTFSSFFATVPLSREELQSLADAAFELYKNRGSRTFPANELEEKTSVELANRLEAAGVIKRSGDNAYFTHHLAHDYLAATSLVTKPRKWKQPCFDVISFAGSSFDSLAMMLEQINTAAAAERLVRALFDWNPYAAAYCLAEQKREGVLGFEMRVVIFAMMAERRFDLIDATARRASDALRLSSTEPAKHLMAAQSLENVFEYVRNIDSAENWFSDWRHLFTTPRSGRLADSSVRHLTSDDSVVGWTMSNVLKRVRLSNSQLKLVRGFVSHQRDVVRWRAVHVLGAFPSSSNLVVLTSVFDRDKHPWVRLGVVRSLIEMAARGPSDIRKRIFSRLKSRLKLIVQDQLSRKELESVLLVSKVKNRVEWIDYVSEVLRDLYDQDTGQEARERFERINKKFNETYA
ncbi:MAG TPA: hypothetical protein VLY23_05455 [Candidatus Acidoferrum sp.]|nr:hypothetical protein [Candidatus Acidoferrum sp.]